MVYQQTTSTESIPLDQLHTGVYFISINANNKTTTKRFVVQH